MMIGKWGKFISIQSCLSVGLISVFLFTISGCGGETSENKSSSVDGITSSHTSTNSKDSNRIQFAKGAYSAVVTGKLDGFDSEQSYVIEVGKGQAMTVEQIDRKENQYVSLIVNAPNGENANDMDLSCHSNATVSPTAGGDYTIKVTECLKADPWMGSYSLKVTVK